MTESVCEILSCMGTTQRWLGFARYIWLLDGAEGDISTRSAHIYVWEALPCERDSCSVGKYV